MRYYDARTLHRHEPSLFPSSVQDHPSVRRTGGGCSTEDCPPSCPVRDVVTTTTPYGRCRSVPTKPRARRQPAPSRPASDLPDVILVIYHVTASPDSGLARQARIPERGRSFTFVFRFTSILLGALNPAQPSPSPLPPFAAFPAPPIRHNGRLLRARRQEGRLARRMSPCPATPYTQLIETVSPHWNRFTAN